MAAHALLAALWIGAAALGAERQPMLPVSKPPIVYRFGYTDQYFTDPAYIEQFKAAPPDLLHVGKAVPITHQWGPVGLYAGENQYTGSPQNLLVAANIALLPPEAMDGRIERIRDTLARYHAVGVREIVPYIALHTLAGDHQKRLGFWKFYDQWAEYEKWAGPRPANTIRSIGWPWIGRAVRCPARVAAPRPIILPPCTVTSPASTIPIGPSGSAGSCR